MTGDYTDAITRASVTGGTTGDPLVPTPGPGRSTVAISNKPWSQFSASDYSDAAAYAKACLVNLNTGPPSSWSKTKCKLPVYEPDGDLNRNAVHAAASVLAGGQGGIDAPPDGKKAAARTLLRLYRQVGDPPPDSLKSLAQ